MEEVKQSGVAMVTPSMGMGVGEQVRETVTHHDATDAKVVGQSQFAIVPPETEGSVEHRVEHRNDAASAQSLSLSGAGVVTPHASVDTVAQGESSSSEGSEAKLRES